MKIQFRDLERQYKALKTQIDANIEEVISRTRFIGGSQVAELERKLADYVGVKHCITCANGTDALNLALMVWDIKEGDAVFVPDFTFFASGEVVPYNRATPIFVDVNEDTYNIDVEDLERKIERVKQEGKLLPRAIVAVDLFGQPAEYPEIKKIAQNYNMRILEDSAQGFGGMIGGQMAGSFGDIATTSFFPAKPLGCYGDGGAIFTDNDEWAATLESLRVHGKGNEKYDNVRIGINSRLDTLQAAILLPKLQAFIEYERDWVNRAASAYDELLKDVVKLPVVKDGYVSSWAQYTIQVEERDKREGLQVYLKEHGIPSMVYYPKPMHRQKAFSSINTIAEEDCPVSSRLCDRVLSLPMHPYITIDEQKEVTDIVKEYILGR